MIGRLLIAGHPEATHVGGHFLRAAATLGVSAQICNTADAYAGGPWRRRANWWLRGHRPTRLTEFSDALLAAARDFRPDTVLTTGIAPVNADALRHLRTRNVTSVNFLTDDPWNARQRAPWFLAALPHYDHVFSPRHANLADLTALAGPVIHSLPFGYDPAVHFIDPAAASDDPSRYVADVMLAGGGDADRVRAVTPLIRSGLRVALYGGYWDRYRPTAASARGFLDAPGLRHAVHGAAVCLCLVRRANRDGHSMRSFEVPAMGGCMLVEDTADHRSLFGADGDAVIYFGDPGQAVTRARELVAHPALRQRLAQRAHARITAGAHTYADRLRTILERSATTAPLPPARALGPLGTGHDNGE